jgi:hypothetical protein
VDILKTKRQGETVFRAAKHPIDDFAHRCPKNCPRVMVLVKPR